MEKDKLERLINELVVFFWIGLQPTAEIDSLISEYLEETNQTPTKIVYKINHKYHKKENG